MATRTASWGGNAVEKYFATPMALGIQLDSQEYPTGAITLNLSSASPQKAWINNGQNTQRQIEVYLCDSAGNNAIKIFTVAGFPPYQQFKYDPTSADISNTAKLLKGQALYLKSVGIGLAPSDNAYIGTYGAITMTINTAIAATAVTKGNKILATDRSQIGTPTTAGEVMTDSHFASGTLIEASTFNSKVLGF